MTKVEKFNAIKELVKDNTEYVTFLDAEIARLENRAEKIGAKRAEKNVAKAEAFKEAIVKALDEAGRFITLAELVGAIELVDVTPGRVAYYAGKLEKDGKIAKEKAKVDGRKVMTYGLAE